MCSLCAALGSSRHWTDAAGRPEFEQAGRKVTRRAEREKRAALLDAVLQHYQLRIQDWSGNSYVLTNKRGESANVYNLNGIWAAVDHLLKDSDCDPLDTTLLDSLENSVADDEHR